MTNIIHPAWVAPSPRERRIRDPRFATCSPFPLVSKRVVDDGVSRQAHAPLKRRVSKVAPSPREKETAACLCAVKG